MSVHEQAVKILRLQQDCNLYCHALMVLTISGFKELQDWQLDLHGPTYAFCRSFSEAKADAHTRECRRPLQRRHDTCTTPGLVFAGAKANSDLRDKVPR